MNGWDGHSGGVLLHFGGLFLRDLLKIERERGGRERETEREMPKGMAWPLSDMLLHADHIADHIRKRETQRDIECNKSVSSTQKLHELLPRLIYSTWRASSHVTNTCTYLTLGKYPRSDIL